MMRHLKAFFASDAVNTVWILVLLALVYAVVFGPVFILLMAVTEATE